MNFAHFDFNIPPYRSLEGVVGQESCHAKPTVNMDDGSTSVYVPKRAWSDPIIFHLSFKNWF